MSDRRVEGGYVLLWRELFGHTDFMSKPLLHRFLFVWLLAKANHKDRNRLKRGQCFTTIREMQEAMSHFVGYRKITPSKDKIRSAYEALTKATLITTMKTTRGLIITILNYNKFQDSRNYEAHTEAHTEDSTKPTEVPHYKQELKNGRKEKGGAQRKTAGALISFLNQVGNRDYKFTDNNRKGIIARLKQGFTEDDARAVITWANANGWFVSHPEHYNPITLFRESNFEKYLQASRQSGPGGEKPLVIDEALTQREREAAA